MGKARIYIPANRKRLAKAILLCSQLLREVKKIKHETTTKKPLELSVDDVPSHVHISNDDLPSVEEYRAYKRDNMELCPRLLLNNGIYCPDSALSRRKKTMLGGKTFQITAVTNG